MLRFPLADCAVVAPLCCARVGALFGTCCAKGRCSHACVSHSYRSWVPVHVLAAPFPLSGALPLEEWLIRTVDYELEFVINV